MDEANTLRSIDSSIYVWQYLSEAAKERDIKTRLCITYSWKV